MDAPVETPLESTDHAGQSPNKLPELSRSQTNLHIDGPPPSLKRGKSLRTRPDVVAQQQNDAVPLPPLKDSAGRPELWSRTSSSKMSLFNLFSKPKVEKLRGYAEPGLETPAGPPRANSNSAATLQKPDIAVRVQHADAEQGRVRPTTSRSYTGRGARFIPVKEHLPPLPTDRRPRPFDPPPLFQVWPQARKHGVLEVASVAAEPTLHKSKSRSSGSLFEQANLSSLNIPGNRGSGTTVKTAIRHVASGSISNQSLPEKIIVLTTSGFLLQYANEGPTDRLPERILQLGKDSAAYASDLIPGKHHVLQVAQAVNQHGAMVPTSHSILSRFGIRNQAAKRLSPNFLIVMPGATEMDDWMVAIRREIEVLGGKRVRSDSAASGTVRPKTGDAPKIDLKKTPSQSHRYQVKRDPTKPSIVTSPSTEALEAFPSPQPEEDPDTTTAKAVDTPIESNDADAAIPEIQAAKARPRASSDTPSNSSSTGTSVEQQQLDKLRSSVRASHSTVATSVTAASRTNSMTSTPPSDLSKENSEGPVDANATKVPYRSLSSYTLAKRRSAAPLSLKDAPLPEGTKIGDFLQQRITIAEGAIDSPIVGYASPMPEPNPSPTRNRLSAVNAQSVPNLKVTVDDDSKNGPKTASPLAGTPVERPESFIADLPDPTTWNKVSPSSKSPAMPMPLLLDTAAARAMQKADIISPSYSSPQSRPLRSNSNSFSLPLRAQTNDSTPPRTTKRASGEAEVFSPIPAVTTLTAKVDFASRTTIDSSNIPDRTSSANGSPPNLPIKSPKRTPSARLSLFPTAAAAPPPVVFIQPQRDDLKRSTSATVLQATAQAQANGLRLARPASLQVRSDHAPFLSSVRNSGAPTGQPRVTTVPIRSLKPSRSVATMQTVPSTPSFNLKNTHLAAEATDVPTSLPGQTLLDGIPSRPPSRTRRTPRSRTSLPTLDFGMPLVGLGPPAPPPQAPLPEIPTASRPQSPENATQMRNMATPIGVAICESINEEPERPAATPVPMGLGIQVGGAD